jgi:integrase
MASVYRQTARKGYRVQFYCRGVRRQLWLGNVKKSAADNVANHLEQLAAAATINATRPAASMIWAKSIDRRLFTQLVDWGVLPADFYQPISVTLAAWCESYLATRPDLSKSTRRHLEESRDHAVRILGGDRLLPTITESDAQLFGAKILDQYAPSTAGRIVKRLRQYFAAAVEAKVMDKNPFLSTEAPTRVLERQSYVSEQDAALILSKLPDATWRAIFSLTRWAGLRCPSEVLALRWTDIDWELNRMIVSSAKTKRYGYGSRKVPLFPRVREALGELQHIAGDGQTYVIHRYRSATSSAQLRAPLLAAIQKAGLQAWEKLYVNLRASCRTDLERRFPAHVCDAWLGHSTAVARKHYLQVTEDDWTAASCVVAGVVVQPISADSSLHN